jgi:A/G-specific adenine glycosylase
VAAIAFDMPVLAVDANVERVLARLFAVEAPLPKARPELRRIARELPPPARPGDAVQALMELGALVCRPSKPACLACPLRQACAAHRLGLAETLPRKAPKATRAARFASAFHLTRPDGAVLFRRRPEDGLLGGLIELPSTPWRQATPSRPRTEAPADASWRRLPGRVRHVFTHLTLEVDLWVAKLEDEATVHVEEPIWCLPGSLHSLALPTLTRRLLAHVERGGTGRD